jgi:hypothetical protein
MTHEEFKQLPKPEYDLFVSKLLYAIHGDMSCYQYATIPMKVDIKKLSFEAFKALPKPEHDELISAMLQNINRNKDDFDYADWIVQAAEVTGMYKDVQFNIEEHPAPDMIGAVTLS